MPATDTIALPDEAPAETSSAEREVISWRLIVRHLWSFRRRLLIGNICSVISSLAVIPIPLLLPILVDEVALGLPKDQLLWVDALVPVDWQSATGYLIIFALAALFLRLLVYVADLAQSYIFINISQQVTLRIRTRLLSMLQPVAMVEYETVGSGEVASRLVTDVNTIDELVAGGLGKFIIGLVTVVGVMLVVFWLDPILALFLLLLNPTVIYFGARIGKRVKNLKKEQNRAVEVLQRAFIDTFDAMQQIRVSNSQSYFFKQLRWFARDLRGQSARYAWGSMFGERTSSLLFMLGFDIFRTLAFAMVIFSDMTVGGMFAVFAYLWIMLGGMQQVWQLQYKYYSANGAMERINQLAQLRREPVRSRKVDAAALRGALRLRIRDLSFKYPNTDKLILQSINLDLAAGSKTAIRGDSGGGKSTLVQLLSGLYPPDSGSVLINDLDISDYRLEGIRARMAVVLQQPALLNSSLRVNLLLGSKHSDARLYEVLRVAELAQFVDTLPEGLETIVGNHGLRLSGGQRQRLAIARSLLRDPGLVIFDEATSALDPATEAKVHQNLNAYLQEATILIFAHRQSALDQAQQQYRLVDGGLVQLN